MVKIIQANGRLLSGEGGEEERDAGPDLFMCVCVRFFVSGAVRAGGQKDP